MQKIEDIVEALAERGYAVSRQFLAPELISALRGESERLNGAGRFRSAGIGSGGDHRVREHIRGDSIC